MLRRLINALKKQKGQNTAEYAILISIVVGGIIAMQTYTQRALQARVRDSANYMVTETAGLGSTLQYEPYYLESEFNVTRSDAETTTLDDGTVAKTMTNDRTRAAQGFQESGYDGAIPQGGSDD